MRTSSPVVPAAHRVGGFSYAIRNIVAEARKVEAAGRRVRYLNIGDPVAFGFQTPPHLVEAVRRAMVDGHNGYVPSPGIPEAREAIARNLSGKGATISPDHVVLSAGTSEGIELALAALLNDDDVVLVPSPTYPLYTAVIAKLGARAAYYRTDPENGWMPDLDHIAELASPHVKALVVIDPNNPTGAVYPRATREALLQVSERHGWVLMADECYTDLAYDGPVAPLASLDPDAAVISFGSLSKAYLAPGWRTGWLTVSRNPRMTELLAGILKLADARLCSPGPMQYAVTDALNGDHTFQEEFRRALSERADLTTRRLNAIPGFTCVRPRGAFYAMPQVALPPGRTDEDFILNLLRETGVLCVYGSGFGTDPADGFFRVVYLADPKELNEVFDLVGEFSRDYLSR
ncbi:MAG: aminotransferase class I/II-fold pyridoxal phosphate-dependent enzyme [Vicinamibacterales bacterium]